MIDHELHKLEIDIASLQETRLTDTGSIRETNYTLHWHCKSAEDHPGHGVDFAVSSRVMQKIEAPVATFECIITLHLSSDRGLVSIISPCTPYLYAEGKNYFFDSLHDVLEHVPHGKKLFVLGDFNTCVE